MDMMADRNYVLRNKQMELFAGFKPGPGLAFIPVFVLPGKGKAVQANVIHEDDVRESIDDLKKFGHEVDMVQVS